jgi:flavin-dependent dehydrogenase
MNERSKTHRADVVVIGGGPAGSTAATMLARAGWRVVLFERERFPRQHIGESLLPASMPILEALGVMPAIQEAGFLKKWGATMVWGASPEPWSWYFRETNRDYPHSYQVWRPQFDQLLLENSRAAGVDVREGWRALEVVFDEPALTPQPRLPTSGRGGDRSPGRATGVLVAGPAGREERWEAGYVVDASGQEGLIGRALRLRETDEQFRNLALFAYFEGAERLPEPDQTNILIESYEDGWTWVIPLHTGWTSVGFVMDSQKGQEVIARLGFEAAFEAQLAMTAKTAAMLRKARRVAGPTVIRDWSYVSTRVAGDGYVLAGDAACFIDPLFSTGVHLALSAGVMAAALVTSALKDPAIGEPAAKVYQELYYHQYGLFRELARLFYASNRTVDSYFWEARRIIGADETMVPRDAFIRAAAGQPPRGYERVVLEQGVAPEGVLEGVRAVEGERSARQREVEALRADANGLGCRVPVLTEGARVERKPVLGEGEFVWGHAIVAPDRPDVPVSAAVAALVALLDGRTDVAGIVERAGAGLEADAKAQLARVATNALGILYVDGVVAELALSPRPPLHSRRDGE